MKTLFISVISVVLSSGVAYADDKTIQKQFYDLDKDADGLITRDEVQSQPTIIRYMNLFYKDSFRTADINNDGVLDREEFVAHEEELPAE